MDTTYLGKFFVDLESIFLNQEYVFSSLLGITPNLDKRYKSILRADKTPGCRFSFHNGKLYFIDNRGINGKLAFNCIECVAYLQNLSYFDAARYIMSNSTVIKKNFKPIIKSKTLLSRPIIRIQAEKWSDTNNYFKHLDIPCDYLSRQPYYTVKNYWITNKKGETVLNKFGTPNIDFPVIAYVFDTRIKLYFPNTPKDKIKWYSNCIITDYFGEHRLDFESDTVILTKSAKDEVLLNYHLNVNTIALQQEGIPKKGVSNKLKWILGFYENIYIWMDNDSAGIKCAYMLKKEFPNSKLLFTPNALYKDPSDYYKFNKKEFFDYVKKNIK